MSSKIEAYPLVGKPFESYSPEAFRDYIKSLKVDKNQEKKAELMAKGCLPGITARITKTGKFSIINRRKPMKYITEAEIAFLSKHWKQPYREVWATANRLCTILKNPEEATKRKKSIEEIPWN